jgi:hypothetical protein
VMALLQLGQREHRARAEEQVRKQRQQGLSSPSLTHAPEPEAQSEGRPLTSPADLACLLWALARVQHNPPT